MANEVQRGSIDHGEAGAGDGIARPASTPDLALSVLHDALIASDGADTIVAWDNGAALIFGWSEAEAIGQPRHDLLRPAFPLPEAEISARLTSSGKWLGEVVYIAKDGSLISASCVVAARFDARGEIVARIEGMNIVPEKTRVDTERRRNQIGYLEEAQRLAQTGVFSWNFVSGEIYWSEETYRICGIDPATELTIPIIGQYVHPDDLLPFRGAVQKMVAERGRLDHEHRMVHLDGTIKHIHMVGHFLSQQPTQFVGAVIDISDRVRSQAILQRVQTEFAHAARVLTLGELAASIAHEVNQPLAAITTNASASVRWLDRPEPDLEEIRILTASISADARRAADIVARIRRMAMRGEPERVRLSLDEIIMEAAAFVRHELQAQQVQVVLDLQGDMPGVLGDRTQMQQVIVNLVVNAAQAMSTLDTINRLITVKCHADAATACVEVRDNGPGIAPENIDRLFDSFFTTKEAGLGIGLPICRSIVEAHGGVILVENALQGGASFKFSLPVMTN